MAKSPAEETAFKQTQAEVLAREIDTNEFIPELSQLTTDTKSVLGALNYLHGQLRTAILNANSAQRVANDAKAVVESFTANPPKDGKSAYEIANDLRPEGNKFKNEQDWVDSLEGIKEETLQKTMEEKMDISVKHKKLSVTIEPQEWHHRSDKGGGFTYTIENNIIKKNHDVTLDKCRVDDPAIHNLLVEATCDSITDGEIVLRIPECERPTIAIELEFSLREYVIEKKENA